MNVVCVYNSKLPGWFGATAITLYPFLFFALSKESALSSKTLAHEMVHVRQVRKLGWLRFYWKYVVEYFKWRLKGMDADLAYRTTSFEREAYDAQASVVFTDAEKKELEL